MSETLSRVQALVASDEFEVSRHGLLELAADKIMLRDVVAGVGSAITIEDYPLAQRGPSVLALQRDKDGLGIHVLWGIPKDAHWSEDLRSRKR